MSYSFVIPWEPCVTQLPLPSPRHTVFPLHTHQNHVSREMLLRDKQRFPAFPGASNWLCSKNILFSLREKLWYWSDHILICSLVYHYCWTQATISKRHKNNYVLGMQVPETSIAIIFFHTSAFTVKRPWVRGREKKRKKINKGHWNCTTATWSTRFHWQQCHTNQTTNHCLLNPICSQHNGHCSAYT